MSQRSRTWRVVGLAALGVVAAAPTRAELAVSANDGKQVLENGVTVTVRSPPPDTVSVIDLSVSPPRLIAEIEAPTSLVGPPTSVAIAPDESFALVTAATKVDPADPTKVAPDDKVTVIDLKASPPRVVATLQAGRGASGVSINRAGTLALVANRAEGTVSVFTIAGGALAPAGKVAIGDDKSGPSHPAFSRDGTMALVTRDGDNKVSILSVDGAKVEYTKRDLGAGLRPYGLDIVGDGAVALVANIGTGVGDADTISVVDMKAKPPRVVNTVSVGQTPEGIKVSPDGRHVAVTVMNGTNKAKTSPFYNDQGLLQVWRIEGVQLVKAAEAQIGHWCQGIAWSKDSRTLLAQCIVERSIDAFGFDGRSLTKTGSVATKSGPAGIRTSEP